MVRKINYFILLFIYNLEKDPEPIIPQGYVTLEYRTGLIYLSQAGTD
jgi:hypothetical protein